MQPSKSKTSVNRGDRRVTVTLPRALANYVRDRVEMGYFVTESDVIRHALLNSMRVDDPPSKELSDRVVEANQSALQDGTLVIEEGDLRSIVERHGRVQH